MTIFALPRLERLPASSAPCFAAFQHALLGFSSPVDRLERDDVYVLRAPDGAILGGAAISTRAPFRSLEAAVPARDRAAVEARIDAAGCLELYGAVLRPELRGTWRSTYFWLALGLVILRYGRRRLLASTVERGLKRLYEGAGARLVYTGAVTYFDQPKTSWVFLWSIWTMPFLFLAAALRRHARRAVAAARPYRASPQSEISV